MIWIGDVHGCLKTFEALLKRLPKEKETCCLGDLVDRGPDPMGCLRLAMSEIDYVLLGNHEIMMFRTLMQDDMDQGYLWIRNGGQALYEDVLANPALGEEIISTLDNFSLWMESETSIGVHACIPVEWNRLGIDGLREKLQDAERRTFEYLRQNKPLYPTQSDLLWERKHNSTAKAAESTGKTMVVGHSIQASPEMHLGRVMMIDCGCFLGRNLCAWDDETGEIYLQEFVE